jgi:hypothetical protein
MFGLVTYDQYSSVCVTNLGPFLYSFSSRKLNPTDFRGFIFDQEFAQQYVHYMIQN